MTALPLPPASASALAGFSLGNYNYFTMENSYSWHITEHAKKRWEARVQRPLSEMGDLLDRSKPIPKSLRKILVQSSKSARHRECLAKGTGFLFRIAERIVFVVENLSVVTVYPIPDAYAEVKREANRKAKKNAKAYKAKMLVRAALLAKIKQPTQAPAVGESGFLIHPGHDGGPSVLNVGERESLTGRAY